MDIYKYFLNKTNDLPCTEIEIDDKYFGTEGVHRKQKHISIYQNGGSACVTDAAARRPGKSNQKASGPCLPAHQRTTFAASARIFRPPPAGPDHRRIATQAKHGSKRVTKNLSLSLPPGPLAPTQQSHSSAVIIYSPPPDS